MSARPLSSRFRSRLLLNAVRLQSCQTGCADSSEQGLSLIECLVAIVVIAITVVAITPPVFLATATRIQSRRAEQANQIAQAEIDRVRTIVERGTYTENDLPGSTGDNGDINAFGPATTVAPVIMSSANNCTAGTKYPLATPTSPTALIPVDIQGDCTSPQFAIQVFRTKGCTPSALLTQNPPSPPYSFFVGVRVYTYTPGETFPTLATSERATLAMTQGRRDQAGSNRKPLQMIYTKLARVTKDNILDCAGDNTTAPSPSPSPSPSASP